MTFNKSWRQLLGGALVVVVVWEGAAVIDGQARPVAVRGAALPPWTPGMLDIHQISTGRGNAALMRFPGGASLLSTPAMAATFRMPIRSLTGRSRRRTGSRLTSGE